jgi:hypothetical protein
MIESYCALYCPDSSATIVSGAISFRPLWRALRREGERMCMCVRERKCVCACVRERELWRENVCACVRERELCVCVCEGERMCVCVNIETCRKNRRLKKSKKNSN